MLDRHVDWSAAGGANSGSGTSGDPWGSIAYAIAQQVLANPDLSALGGLTIHVHDTANTGCPTEDRALDLSLAGFTNASTTNFITIRAGDDKRPTGTGPVLEINPTAANNNWNISVTGTVIDGFYFHHTGTGVGNHTFLEANADANKALNCRFYSEPRTFGTSARYIRYHTNFVAENCLFRGGREHFSAVGGSSTLKAVNCGFVDQNTADTSVNFSASPTIYNCFFFNVSQAFTAGTVTGAGNAIDSTTTKGTASAIWAVDTTLTSSAFNNYVSADYRAANGGALHNTGSSTAGQFTATDMFGVTRSSPDIGYSEFVSGSTPTISDAGDEAFRVGEVGVSIVCTNAGASQGNGRVFICPSDDVNDVNGVEQTVTAWGDTGITFNVVRGTLPLNQNVYLFLENDGGNSNAAGYVVQILPSIAVLAAALGLLD
jgi:hypothetical protein